MKHPFTIIAISGKKQSGKDTLCQFMREYIGPEISVRIGFADALKEEIATSLSCTVQFIDDNKPFFRPLLQWWGTYKRVYVDKNYWVKKAFRKLLDLPPSIRVAIIPDLRYENEFFHLRSSGAILLRIKKDLVDMTDTHSSETELDSMTEWSHVVDNNSTFDDLQEQARIILQQHKLI